MLKDLQEKVVINRINRFLHAVLRKRRKRIKTLF